MDERLMCIDVFTRQTEQDYIMWYASNQAITNCNSHYIFMLINVILCIYRCIVVNLTNLCQ